jgi:hypothetical protein
MKSLRTIINEKLIIRKHIKKEPEYNENKGDRRFEIQFNDWLKWYTGLDKISKANLIEFEEESDYDLLNYIGDEFNINDINKFISDIILPFLEEDIILVQSEHRQSNSIKNEFYLLGKLITIHSLEWFDESIW